MSDQDDYPATIDAVRVKISRARNETDSFLATLTEVQKQERGTLTHWAIKDHVAHLAVWEQGVVALLEGRNRWQAMGIDAAIMAYRDMHYDDLNALIFLRYKHASWDEAYALYTNAHQAVLERLTTLTDVDLQHPEMHWQEMATDESDTRIVERIAWNTYEHYEEHLPWMREALQPHITINHLAVVVPDIGSALSFWRDALGLKPGEHKDVPQEQVRVAFVEAGENHIELVQPTSSESGIAAYLAKKGAGMHHLCFDVPDMERAMARLREHGATLLSETYKVRDGRKYIFVHPKSTGGVLVELYENS